MGLIWIHRFGLLNILVIILLRRHIVSCVRCCLCLSLWSIVLNPLMTSRLLLLTKNVQVWRWRKVRNIVFAHLLHLCLLLRVRVMVMVNMVLFSLSRLAFLRYVVDNMVMMLRHCWSRWVIWNHPCVLRNRRPMISEGKWYPRNS